MYDTHVIILTYFILQIGSEVNCQTSSDENETVWFDKRYVGAVFEPYTKANTLHSNYTIEEVKEMLHVVATKFHYISTYGMGTVSLNQNWSMGNAGGFSAVAAANVNKNLSELALQINIGTWALENGFFEQEIENAFEAAKDANKIYNGTALGVIISNYYDKWDAVYGLLNKYSKEAEENGLKLGIRTAACETLTKNGQKDSTMKNVITNVDFIICQRLPDFNGIPSQQVEFIGQLFLTWRENFTKLNNAVEVIGETGWHSLDLSVATEAEMILNLRKIKNFWTLIADWTKENKFRIDMFCAFDEPWKISMGVEQSHWGWWERVRSDTSTAAAFKEKISKVWIAQKTEQQENKKRSTTFYSIVIGSVFAGGLLILFVLGSILFLYSKLQKMKNKLLSKAEIDEFKYGLLTKDDLDGEVDALKLPYNNLFEIPKSKFQIDRSKLLGSGAFGSVYRGTLEGYSGDVAFKVTKANCSAASLKSLLSEIKVMIHVGKHPNVIPIIAAYTKEIAQGITMIAVELCDTGLERYLRANKVLFISAFEDPNNITSGNIDVLNDKRYVNFKVEEQTPIQNADSLKRNLVKWCYEIACGMEHIASKKIIHSDLATRNVLLQIDGTAKISDFGLSRHIYEYTNYVKSNQEPLPWKWLAPESLKTMTFSTKSDVWAYGITLWEIFSFGDTPYPGLAWSLNFPDEIGNGLRMYSPKYAPTEIYTVMTDCWSLLPEDRPDFKSISKTFHGLLTDLSSSSYIL